MAKGQIAGIVQHLSRLLGVGPRASLPDHELVQQFVDHRDQAAFARLLQRHGPLVLGVCRQVLGDHHEAEDAFQAAFFVLARKAGTIRQGESLAGWLYQVAYRIALRARVQVVERREQVRQVADMAIPTPVSDSAWQELRPVLHAEVSRLPAKYRVPVVLCYLQGKSNEEAALEMGCPVGTLKGRLHRARDLLRTRLERRGLTLAAGVFVADGAHSLATAVVPVSLAETTVQAAVIFGTIHAGAASTTAAQLAEGVLHTMFVAKLRSAVLVALFAGLLATGSGAFLYRALFAQGTKPLVQVTPMDQTPAERDVPPPPGFDAQGDPLPPGAVARLGTLRWRQSSPFDFAAFLPNGAEAISAGTDGIFRVWQADTGKELRQFGKAAPRGHGFWRVALAPDGRLLAEATADIMVHLWDVPAGKEIRSIKVSNRAGSRPALVFAPDSKTLFTGTIFEPVIRQFDVANGQEIRQFPLQKPASAVYRVAVSPNGQWLLMEGSKSEGNIASAPYWTLLDLASGKETRHIQTGDERYNGGFFTGDSKSLALIGNTRRLGLFDLTTGKKLQQIDLGNATAISSADGNWLATLNRDDHLVRLWDPHQGKPVRTLAQLREASRGSGTSAGPAHAVLAFAPDNRTLLASGGSCALRLWDVTTGTERSETGHVAGVAALRVAPDGQTVLSWGTDNTVRQWRTTSGKEQRSCPSPAEWTQGVRFWPDGKSLLIIQDKTLQRLNIATGKEDRLFPTAGDAPQPSGPVDISADGRVLATLANTTCSLWDTATGQSLRRFTVPTPTTSVPYEGYAHGLVVLSPDGSLALVTFAHYVRATMRVEVMRAGTFGLWNTTAGKLVREGKGALITAAAFAPDGLTLALATDDKALVIQEVASGQVRLKLSSQTGGCNGLAYAPDGRTLIAANHDHTLRAWDTATGKEIAVLRGHRGPVNVVAYAPDGARVYSGSEDTTVLGWDTAAFSKEGRPRVVRLDAAAVEDRFRDLAADNAAKAHEAIVALSQDPDQAVATLRRHLRPASGPTPQGLAQLLADLGGDKFAVREQASRELLKLGELAEPALHEALRQNPTLEARQRIEQILAAPLSSQPLPAEVLQTVRAIEVLGQIGSAEARQALHMLANGAPGARITREAQAALRRSQPILK